jgi:subtilisin family serine protease
MGMMRAPARVTAAAAVAVAVAAAPGARAIPPMPVETVPCVAAIVPEQTVLVQAPASVPVPADARSGGELPALGVRVLVLPTAARATEVARALRATPGVAWAQVDSAVHAMRTPNDPLLIQQWALDTVHAPAAWDVETGRRNQVLAAVLDTGVDASHPDLIGHVRAGGDFVDGDPNPADEFGHGTAVSGVLAASTNNKVGVAGISWGATVLAERVLGTSGSGSMCTVAAGIIDAVDAGAKVLNLSLGGSGDACPLIAEKALSYAHDHGALVVVSAGNDGMKGNPVDYPAGCSGAFAVGATDTRDRKAAFSEYGPQIDITAPGVGILTAAWGKDAKHGLHGYAFDAGTSVSAPIVSGAAALLMSRHPEWTPDQVRARLVATAQDKGKRGRDDFFGAGIVDIGRALH